MKLIRLSVLLTISTLCLVSYPAFAAVTLDTSGAGTDQNTATAGSHYTVTYTVGSGSGAVLLFAVSKNSGGSSQVCSAVTFNSVAMTLLEAPQNGGNLASDVWALANPTQGSAQTIDCTVNALITGHIAGFASSYLGVGTISNTTSGSNGSAASLTKSLVTTASNSWVFGFAENQGGTPSASTGVTDRTSGTVGASGSELGDSGGAQGVGSYSMTWTGSNAAWVYAMAEIPATGSTFNPSQFSDF